MVASSLLIVLRMYVLINNSMGPVSPNQTLTDVASIAIWDKNKIVVATAFSIWVINAAFFLQRKLLLPCPTSDLEPISYSNVVGHRCRAGD
jgi:hypothetical protein